MARRKMVRELPAYCAAVRRLVASAGRRVGQGDVEGLAELAAIIDAAEQAMTAAVVQLVTEQGYSWSDVARGLGVTKQTAHAKYRKAVAA